MAKLALIIDHMSSHNLAPPGERAVRGFGHDIKSLYDAVGAKAQARGLFFANSFIPSGLQNDILEFLSEFARSMRMQTLMLWLKGLTKESHYTSGFI